MQTAESVLTAINSKGRKGMPITRLYRQLYNTNLYEAAYGKIYANHGATTPGVDSQSLDGMSYQRMENIIEKMRWEKYQPVPVRRGQIPKGNGQMRPLGLPSGDDKIVQEVLRMLLEAYYEPQFSDRSHGFRPGRGCHTALNEISRWTGTRWFIEADIKGCFDNINHEILLEIIGRSIRDGRMLELVRRFLKAGVMYQWGLEPTHSGTPQGGILSPILANIYLSELDQFIKQELIPRYTRGRRRRDNPEYNRLSYQIKKALGARDVKQVKELRKQRRQLPSVDPHDPNYRRLLYIRYADDFLLGFIGPKQEAETILQEIQDFLAQRLKLVMSGEKTRVTHGRSMKTEFLGYRLGIMYSDHKLTQGGRYVNGKVWMGVPRQKIDKIATQFMRGGEPRELPHITEDSVEEIINLYQTKYRGFANYYQYAHNRRTISRLKWIMQESLVKTLAAKMRISCKRVYKRYATTVEVKGKEYRVIGKKIETTNGEKLVYWGGIALTREKPNPHKPLPEVDYRFIWWGRNELIQRMRRHKCELCGQQGDTEVHHIRKLRYLHKRKRGTERPPSEKMMMMRRRKTLVVCKPCHHKIHKGQL